MRAKDTPPPGFYDAEVSCFPRLTAVSVITLTLGRHSSMVKAVVTRTPRGRRRPHHAISSD